MKIFNCLSCGKSNPVKGKNYANKYCNNQCQRNAEVKERIRQWLEEGIDWKGQVPAWAKSHLRSVHGNKCANCGITEWMSKPIVLECDHINGCSDDNTVNNLRLLCPNCHSQTNSFKGKNRGNGRLNRYAKLGA